MSIDVLIKQKLFGSKIMPLEVILGEHLHYGNFVNDQLHVGELGETEFIAYNPESIGRGFSVVWNPKEKKTIALRLPQPSTTQELKDFYGAIERMVNYWNGKLIVDGSRVSLPEFLSAFNNMVDFRNLASPSADYVDGIIAIFHVKGRARIAIAIYQVLIVPYIYIEAETFSLRLHCPYPYHSRYRSIIERSRICNDLYILYLARMQRLQFVLILNPASIDIEYRLAFAYHLKLIIPLCHAGDL